MMNAVAWGRSICAVGLAWGAGDIMCQSIEKNGSLNELDKKRTIDFILVGGLLLGPANHAFELWVEQTFPGIALRQICKKVLTRVFIAPGFLTLSFGAVAFIKGDDIQNAVLLNVFPAWCTGSLFWPLASAFAYRFVPLTARPAFGSALGAIWSTYLSFMAHRKHDSHSTNTTISSSVVDKNNTASQKSSSSSSSRITKTPVAR
uniref:Uncharacterized protein n=1 Tax=Aureoumbra lagunensis TaxID=44058 RepID=A0A7S3K1N3_9STRA|mmetsp:Transcript_3345/g.4657  ORF Transcript_3345/g.4657 Transcript_3345/m.4657 type:complete len:204 (+) Transcript_3345:18-629(+)